VFSLHRAERVASAVLQNDESDQDTTIIQKDFKRELVGTFLLFRGSKRTS